MRIVHLAYNTNHHFTDPDSWFERTKFFNGILEAMAKYNEVINIHFISYEGYLEKGCVKHYFQKIQNVEKHLPFRINALIRQLNPDIIIVHGLLYPHQILLLHYYVKRHVKIIVQHHAERPLTGLRKFLQKRVDKFIHAYLFASKELATNWLTSGLIGKSSKVHEVMEVSSTFYPLKEANDNTDFNNTYIWVGRLDQNKDPFTLVSGFQEFLKINPRAKLIVIFRGDELLREVRSLITSNNIELKENVDHGELLYWYNRACYILSTSHYEGSGTAVCEGMSCGCIPILSDIPSFRMMTNHGEAGLHFTPGSVEGLRNALVASGQLDVNDKREKVLKQFHEKLSSDAIAIHTLNVINSIRE
jgi:glycosyltransferase involved in cell wall biosynthesis